MSLASIQQLPSSVANQIAAGEVVERPLSVIKELLENALDAKATSLVIDIEKGGLGLCRVRDDGNGIPSDQLLLAVAPHATSKITSVDDLMALHSLGFRGEALASISSVSRFTLTSKPKAQETASQLRINEHENHLVQSAAHPNGTTIEVRDLFYNVPVRRTFLKSEKTEFSHIELVVKKIALSQFQLSILLTHNGKTHLKLPAAITESDVKRRISRVLGKAFITASTYFEDARDEFKLQGWLGSPDYLRSQADLQYLFLNGRMVRDKVLMHAVRKVYEPYLYPGRAACFLLYFNLPTQEVDVNVHPTKHEVRFKSPRSVHDFIVSILSKQLANMEDESADPEISQTKPMIFEPLEEIVNTKSVETKKTKRMSEPTQHVVMPMIDGQIIALNKTHALLVHDNESFVFNVATLYQQQLLARIEQMLLSDKTLVSRPVLVPLMVPLSDKLLDAFPFEKVQAFGFDVLPMANNTLAVRAFPVITPHLDIPNCIKAMALQNESFEKVITNNQMVCLSQLSEAEQRGLMRFLIEQKGQSKKNDAYKCVTEQEWQAMLNEK